MLFRSKVIELDSTLTEIHLKLGKLYRLQKDWNNSAASYQQVIKRDTANIDALRELSDIFTRAKQHANAARMFKRLTVLLPDSLNYQIALMRSLINAHASIEAIPIAEKILSQDSKNSEARHNLANAYYDSKKYTEAEVEIGRAHV